MQGTDNSFWVSLSTGNGFTSPALWIQQGDTFHAGQAQYPDVSGDGKIDLVFQGNDNRFWVNLANVPFPDLLTSITTGLGATTSITYKPLTDGSVYTKDSGSTYPILDLQFPLYVVSSVTSSNGIGGTVRTDYSYVGAKADLSGRGLLGFRQMQGMDVATGLKSLTTFRQDWPFTGLPSQTRKLAPNGTILTQVDNTYSCNDFNGGCLIAIGHRYFPFVTQSTQAANDLNGAALPTVTTINAFGDSYGNATEITVSTGDGYSKTTDNTYSNDTIRWFLGRLTGSTVTAHRP